MSATVKLTHPLPARPAVLWGAWHHSGCAPHCPVQPLVCSLICLQAFGKFGIVLDVRVITERDTGVSKGYGFVTMDSPASCQSAMRWARRSLLHTAHASGCLPGSVCRRACLEV